MNEDLDLPLSDRVGLLLRQGGPGSTSEALVTLCMDEGLSVKQAYQLVGRCKVALRKHVDAMDRPDEMSVQLQRLEQTFALAIKLEEPGAAVKALVAINQMLGLRP